MKKSRIFAALSAAAIACSIMTAIPANAAAPELKGNAGVEFQTDVTFNYRDWCGTDGTMAVFPDKLVGVKGGLAFGTAQFDDTVIDGPGTYTVAISASGVVTTSADEKYWYPIKGNTNVTREGSPWSMAGITKPVYDESWTGKEAEITPDAITDWVFSTKAKKFNMLGVTTDIPVVFIEDDNEVLHCYLDDSKEQEVVVTALSANIAGTEYTATEAIPFMTTTGYLGICVINNYSESAIDPAIVPPEDGTVSITFTLDLIDNSIHVPELGQPVIDVNYTSNTSTLKFGWSAVDNADGYYVYAQAPTDADFKKVATSKTNSAIITGLKADTEYKIKVVPYAVAGGEEYAGPASDVKSMITTSASTAKVSITKADITLAKTKVSYTGKRVGPNVIVKYNGKLLTKNKDYKLGYTNCIDPGKATVTVTGMGDFTGKKKLNYYIVPQKPTITKATSTKKKTIALAWKKDAKADGYQIQLSLKKDFSKISKSVLVKKNSTVKGTISGLTSGKKYYVRMRSYKTIDGKKMAGAFSAVKYATIK